MWHGPRVWLRAAACALVMVAWTPRAGAARPRSGQRPGGARAAAMPAVFEANFGQAPAADLFLARAGGVVGVFGRGEATFAGRNGHITLSFAGSREAPRGLRRLAGQVNYLIGNRPDRWLRHVPIYAALDYPEAYPGVQATFYERHGRLEQDFVVAAGANPARIRFRLAGVSGLHLNPRGDLESASGAVVLRRPQAYQTMAGGRRRVRAAFDLQPRGMIGIDLGAYARKQPLIIDPVLVFATYLDGTGSDTADAVAVDSAGDIVVSGTTTSTDFPMSDAEQARPACGLIHPGCKSIFVTKLNPSGTQLIYSTYLGGSDDSLSGGLALDAHGDAIVAGTTLATDFPHAGEASEVSCPSNWNCFFLASLSPDGSRLNYAGTVGGDQGLQGTTNNGRIAVDSAGNAYLAGVTSDANFQTTSGTLGATPLGYPDNQTFVLKVDPAGKLLYSTLIPGTLPPNANGDAAVDNVVPGAIEVDGSGEITLAGTAGPGMPVTEGVAGASFPNSTTVENPLAGYVLHLNATASGINFASYLPGTDAAAALAVNGAGDLYIAGATTETNLPVGAQSFQKVPFPADARTPLSGYVLELGPGAETIEAATYVNGTTPSSYPVTSLQALALDAQGDVIAGGGSATTDFPLENPLVTEHETGDSSLDAVLVELSPDLSRLELGSYFGSTAAAMGGADFGALALGGEGRLMVVVNTYGAQYPTTPGVFQAQPPRQAPPANGQHVVVASIELGGEAAAVCFSTFTVDFGGVPPHTSATRTLTISNCGNAPLTVSGAASSPPQVAVSQSCGTMAAGASCPIQLSYSPDKAETLAGELTLSDNANSIPQSAEIVGYADGPAVNVAPERLNFGTVAPGVSSPAQTVTLTDVGSSQDVDTIQSVTASGDFSATSQCGGSVAAAGCTIAVVFTPTAEGTRDGTLSIVDNDPGSPQTVALSGTGGAGPAAGLAPGSLTFAPQLTGTTSAAQNATLTNPGAEALTIAGISVSTGFAQSNTCGTALGGGTSCTIAVRAEPGAPGALSGILTVNDNASGSPQTVALAGTGADATLAPAPGSSTVATVEAGGAADYTLQLAPVDGASGAFALACTGAPAGARCAVTPITVALNASSPAAVTVTVATTASGAMAGKWWPEPLTGTGRRAWLDVWLLAALAALVWLWRRRRAAAALAALLTLAGLALACGGGLTAPPPPQPGTPPGTYTLTLTATDGAFVRSASLTLTVQ